MTRFQRPVLALLLSFSGFLLLSSRAFSPHDLTRRTNGCNVALERLEKGERRVAVFASAEEDSSTNIGETELSDVPASPASKTISSPLVSTPARAVDDKSSYPIDLPSPILLAASMLLAIVGTGVRKVKSGMISFDWQV
jgi:hypothetical protein